MKLSVGKIAFPIEFDNGDKDVIYFNPNDPDLPIRLMKSQEKIGKRIEELNDNDINLKNDGSVDVPDTIYGYNDLSDEQKKEISCKAETMIEILESTKKIICEEIDDAFNGDISSVVFKHCSPLAIVNGEYFILQFLNAIAPEIKSKIKTASSEMEKKMAKHISKYSKI